jgi:hypothetical protein
MQAWKLPEEARASLLVHLRAALSDRPLVLPHGRDGELVEAARRRLGPGSRL